MYAICIYCSRVVLLFINVYNFALTTPNNIPVFQNVAAFYLSILYLVVFVLYPVEQYCVTFDILGEGCIRKVYIYILIFRSEMAIAQSFQEEVLQRGGRQVARTSHENVS